MNRFLVWLTSMLVRLVAATIRVDVQDAGGVIDKPDHPPVIIAFWHNRLFLMMAYYEYYCRGRTALVFISRSRDGQYITDLAARFGIKAVRGSSSRHGTAAALSAIRASHDTRVDLVITPDGPRGPRYQIQPGLLRLAQATQRPIVAVTYQLNWKHELKSWDRFHIPLPFAACRLITSEPVHVPENATEAELAALNVRLTDLLGGD